MMIAIIIFGAKERMRQHLDDLDVEGGYADCDAEYLFPAR